MRFATVKHEEHRFAGALDGERILPPRGVRELGHDTPLLLLRDPPLDTAGAIPVSEVTLLAPVPNPTKIICVGLNNAKHIEDTGRDDAAYPVLFTKFATSLVGPYDAITCPPASEQVDYEAELAVVIGERARRVTLAQAPSIIAGYTAANDMTMRDYQYETHQWLQVKSWDACTPIGSHLVAADELGEGLGLDISLYGPYSMCESQPAWDALPQSERSTLARQGVGMIQAERLRIVDEQMVEVPADGKTMAEIVMRGNNVMLGYLHDREATEQAFRGGWFHSGDLGVMHPDGYVELRDRAKDIVISGGENISTIEVEMALTTHPEVLDVAVVGVPDDKWSERPIAFVVARPGTSRLRQNSSLTSRNASRGSRLRIGSCSCPRCRAPRLGRCRSTNCVRRPHHARLTPSLSITEREAPCPSQSHTPGRQWAPRQPRR